MVVYFVYDSDSFYPLSAQYFYGNLSLDIKDNAAFNFSETDDEYIISNWTKGQLVTTHSAQ